MQERYRQDYDGEFVITKSTWENGYKKQTREWVPNPIENQHISGRAVVVASAEKIKIFDVARLAKHKGGLLGKKRLQIYSCGDTWEKLRSNFYVTFDQVQLNKISKLNYDVDNVVYTSAQHCIRHPGRFYLIPYGVNTHPVATCAYLSAFDMHKEVFFLNVDWTNEKTSRAINQVIETYRGTKFIAVGIANNCPDYIMNNPNMSYMDFDYWVSYCDV